MTGKWKKMTGNINKSETLDYYTNSTIQSSNDNSKCDTSPPRRRRHDSSENERKKCEKWRKQPQKFNLKSLIPIFKTGNLMIICECRI